MITAARMAAVDRNAEAIGVDRRLLMESSANAVAGAVREHAGVGERVEIIAGRGNNGGDGFAAARFLSDFDVRVTLVGHPERITTDIARANWDALQAAEVPTTVVHDSTDVDPPAGAVVVDALLGTGIRGPLREPIRAAVEAINHASGTVIAVDVPSGLDPDGGPAAEVAVAADAVVTFHDRNPVHADLDAPVTVADIGIPAAAERFVGPGDVLTLAERDPAAHKGDHGRALVVGGGPYVGAPALSAIAALRAGCDLVEVAVPAAIADAVASFHPEFIVRQLPGDRLEPTHLDLLGDAIEAADVLAVGPGLGRDPDTEAAVADLLAGVDLPTVVDADALRVLPSVDPAGTIVATPHAGEFAAMGFEAPSDWREAEVAVQEAARELDATVLLKGRYDVVADPSTVRVNRTGNPGMAVGGTGDVLAGAVASLCCRADPLSAATVAAWANGRAGDRLAGAGYGFLASEVADELPHALADPVD
ncbi:MAG: NAD(P)H-hydrate dehydratase [Halobacteriales archaeon]